MSPLHTLTLNFCKILRYFFLPTVLTPSKFQTAVFVSFRHFSAVQRSVLLYAPSFD